MMSRATCHNLKIANELLKRREVKKQINCSPLPWTVEYGEDVKIKDARGDTVATLSHVHLRGRRSHEEVKANAECIISAVNGKKEKSHGTSL